VSPTNEENLEEEDYTEDFDDSDYEYNAGTSCSLY